MIRGHVICWTGFRKNGEDCQWTFTIPVLEAYSYEQFILEKGGNLGKITVQDLQEGLSEYDVPPNDELKKKASKINESRFRSTDPHGK